MVLVFKITAVRPANNLYRENIISGAKAGAQIKFARQPAVFCHADELAVEIHRATAFRSAQVQHDALLIPVLGQLKRRTIDAGRIVVRYVVARAPQSHQAF